MEEMGNEKLFSFDAVQEHVIAHERCSVSQLGELGHARKGELKRSVLEKPQDVFVRVEEGLGRIFAVTGQISQDYIELSLG